MNDKAVQSLIEFMEIDSTTDKELEASNWLYEYLRDFGWEVELDEIEPDRLNVQSPSRDGLKLIFSSHIDTVPPYIPPEVKDGVVFGRGSADAKGVIIAQIQAANRLVNEGNYDRSEIGFLYVIGEEFDHKGAIEADKDLFADSIILGEPTVNKQCSAGKGMLKLTLKVEGEAGHSAYPNSGVSANHILIDILSQLDEICGKDEKGDLGDTHYNVGIMKGGVAFNVFSPSAEAGISFRLVEPSDIILSKLNDLIKPYSERVSLEIEPIFEPVRFSTVDFLETSIAKFNSDAMYLKNHCNNLYLIGPGDIRVAHSDEEHIELDKFFKGIDIYYQLSREILK